MASSIPALAAVNSAASQSNASSNELSPIVGIPLVVDSSHGAAMVAVAAAPSGITTASSSVASSSNDGDPPPNGAYLSEGRSFWGDRAVNALEHAFNVALSAPVLNVVQLSDISLGASLSLRWYYPPVRTDLSGLIKQLMPRGLCLAPP